MFLILTAIKFAKQGDNLMGFNPLNQVYVFNHKRLHGVTGAIGKVLIP